MNSAALPRNNAEEIAAYRIIDSRPC